MPKRDRGIKTLKRIWFFFACLAFAPAVQAKTYQCAFSVKQMCTETGCTPVKPSVWVKLDDVAQTYSRCDAQGCDDHQAAFRHRGATHTVEIPGAGTFLKFMDSGEASEVVSQITMVYVSHGRCE